MLPGITINVGKGRAAHVFYMHEFTWILSICTSLPALQGKACSAAWPKLRFGQPWGPECSVADQVQGMCGSAIVTVIWELYECSVAVHM